MSFLSSLFGFTRAPARPPGHSQPHSQLASGYSMQQGANPASQNTTRRELLRVVLRDTLNRHGIPAAWIGADMLVATSRNRESGIHWRITIKHWDPRLMLHSVAFQQALIKRLMTFDPMAANWLMGISWQIALADESECPPMPHPASWTSHREDDPTSPAPLPVSPSGDVIAGPVLIPDEDPEAAATRADLESLMALRDADFRQHADGDERQRGFEATQPAKL